MRGGLGLRVDNRMKRETTEMFRFLLTPFLRQKQIWSCVNTNKLENGNPWGCHLIITMGYLVALVITVPMGYFNLDDNMIVQVVAFVLTVACWLVWLVAAFFSETFEEGDYNIPAVASGQPWTSQVRKVILKF